MTKLLTHVIGTIFIGEGVIFTRESYAKRLIFSYRTVSARPSVTLLYFVKTTKAKIIKFLLHGATKTLVVL